MRTWTLLPLIILSCCSTPPPKISVEPCRPGVAQRAAPPFPRTLDSIAAAYNRAKTAGLITYDDLKKCSAKVDYLIGVLNARQK